jgi:hypothetical protein
VKFHDLGKINFTNNDVHEIQRRKIKKAVAGLIALKKIK